LTQIYQNKEMDEWVSSLFNLPPLYDELRMRGISLLMKMSFVGKSNRGRKLTVTENG
jgi:hypothetical protein